MTHKHQSHQIAPLPHFIGRKPDIDHIKRIINKSERHHALIIGNPGVGKTALATQTLALAKSHTPHRLSPGVKNLNHTIASFKAESSLPLAFLLDEVFSFTPAEIGEIIEWGSIVATANSTAYRKSQADYLHLITKFDLINLDQPSGTELKQIIKVHAQSLGQDHGLSIPSSLLPAITSLAQKHLHDLKLPAGAITLLEEAVIQACEFGQQKLTRDNIQAVVSQKAGIPVSSLTAADIDNLNTLPDRLKVRVKGQDHAVDSVVSSIKRSRLQLVSNTRPIGSFLFVGPSGVGKTELAKALAQEVFGDPDNMVRLDMSEFSLEHTVQRLIGAPPGYIGFESGGQLTNPVKAKPYSLVLLDEIEKAHPRVFDTFLQVLDDGHLTDGQGQKVDFTNTLIVATSNAGIEDILDLIEEGKSADVIDKEIKEILADYFRLEFLNRFDGIITFHALSKKVLAEIARHHIQTLQNELSRRHITLKINPQTIERLAQQSLDPRYGARGLLRSIATQIETPLANLILESKISKGDVVEF